LFGIFDAFKQGDVSSYMVKFGPGDYQGFSNCS